MKLIDGESLHFNDVHLMPQKNICESRLDVDISSEVIKGVRLAVPIIASNMPAVVNADFIIKIQELGGLGIMHRAFLNKNDYLEELIKVSKKCQWTAASVGVEDDVKTLIRQMVRGAGVNIICIDLANCFTKRAIDLAKYIKDVYGDSVKVILGNTVDPNILQEIPDGAIDALKIGIGSNSTVCTTYDVTGHTLGQFSAVMVFGTNISLDIPIISDGAIRKPKDLCIAIGAGASSVMIGTGLCRCPESAAPIIEIDGAQRKLYSGNASRAVQAQYKDGGVKKGTCPEGKTVYLEIGEPLADFMDRYAGALRSSITYSAARNIPEFQKNARFIRWGK